MCATRRHWRSWKAKHNLGGAATPPWPRNKFRLKNRARLLLEISSQSFEMIKIKWEAEVTMRRLQARKGWKILDTKYGKIQCSAQRPGALIFMRVLFVVFFGWVVAVHSQDLAPNTIGGTYLTVTITGGNAPFAASGSYKFFTSAVMTNYAVLGNAGGDSVQVPTTIRRPAQTVACWLLLMLSPDRELQWLFHSLRPRLGRWCSRD